MHDTDKYLIHANITAEGVVERSDVVGAIFGQTEGLLGDELDLRDLQDSSKVGRIDVQIRSEHGQSFGTVTIASGLDQVETAILAASLETIDRVGPCRAAIEVDDIEDVRAAKRRRVVDRATELVQEAFEGSMLTSEQLVERVREAIRVDDVTDYEGLPAGPRVEESDAVIVVEGRADVVRLLKYGIKNAVAVEGTNVPDAIADLSADRTVTAFLDGDRGGDLILKELAQVGDVDYVALAPAGRSVEDLSRGEVMSALREKVPYDQVAGAASPREMLETETGGDNGAVTAEPRASDGGNARPAPSGSTVEGPVADEAPGAPGPDAVESAEPAPGAPEATETTEPEGSPEDGADDAEVDPGAETETDPEPESLRGHVRQVVGEGSGSVRLVDEEFATLVESPAGEAFERLLEADPVPFAVVLDGELSQRLLDVAAQRGVEQIVAAGTGEFVKQPTGVRVRTADQLLAA
jgi:hypothetical protein